MFAFRSGRELRVFLTYQYDLRPSAAQYAGLGVLLDQTRVLYNAALQARIGNWEYGKRLAARRGSTRPDPKLDAWTPITLYSQFHDLVEIRRDDPDGYGALPSNLLRDTLKRVELAFKGFFRRVKLRRGSAGFPRFKPKSRWRSFGFSEFSGIRLIGSKLHFAGIWGGLPVHLHRPLPEGASIKSATFSSSGKGWTVSLQIEVADVVQVEGDRPIVGVDVGIHHFAALSNGQIIDNPRIGREAARKTRLQRRALSRCNRGSSRRQKVKETLLRSLQATANKRKTFLHQASAAIAKDYSLIVVEDLPLKNMTASAKGTVDAPGKSIRQKAGLNRELLDVAPGMFVSMLTYKAARAGGELIKVNPRGTSQRCSGCGETIPKTLAVRIHRCGCGLVLDRDVNAARNILLLAKAVVGLEGGKPATAGLSYEAHGGISAPPGVQIETLPNIPF